MLYIAYVTEQREPRVTIAVRISVNGLREVDAIAKEEGRTRSDVVRRLLAEAVTARLRQQRRRST